jgi:hypothetical protein
MKPQTFFDYMVCFPLELMWRHPDIAIPVTEEAKIELMTIAGQESNWDARRQGGGGPARSYYQFEGAGGGSGEVLSRFPSQMATICEALDIPCDQNTVFEAMAWNGILQTCMARLLLWGDAAPLPAVGDVQGGWAVYQRNWRPGAPHPEAWPGNYQVAVDCLKASSFADFADFATRR